MNQYRTLCYIFYFYQEKPIASTQNCVSVIMKRKNIEYYNIKII